MKKIWLMACLLAVTVCGAALGAPEKPLTLEQALALAYKHSPLIKAGEADVKSAQGERDQADALPNPVLNFDVENIGGSGAYGGTSNAELSAGVSQLVEIGGKRRARQSIADHGKVIAHYGQDAARLDLKRHVTQLFVNAVAAQEQAVIATDQLKVAKEMYANVNKRVSAAAEPIVQRNKAKILLAQASLNDKQAQGHKKTTRAALNAIWSNAVDVPMLSTATFYKTEKPETLADLANLVRLSLDHKRHLAIIGQSASLLDLEKAQSVPDPSISLGVREFRATNDRAILAGVSIPLAIFDRNRGTIEKARQHAVKADLDRQRFLSDSEAQLTELFQQLDQAWLTSNTIKEDILPQAQEAFAQAKRGYNLGKFPYLEVLDAQRTLADTRHAYIQSILNYHLTKAEIERLTAQDDHTGDKK